MKRALVLAGGGARGAYQIGAYRALTEFGYYFDIITGTSVGALNGAMFTAQNVELAEKMWQEITTERIIDCQLDIDEVTAEVEKRVTKIFVSKAIKDHCIDQSPLRELIEQTLDIDAFYDSPINFGITATKYPSLTPVSLFKNEIPRENLIDYLMASSACFPAMKPYPINGSMYIDGGYSDYMPINMAIAAGAEEVVAINLHAAGIIKKQKDRSIKVIHIHPREELGLILLFSPTLAKRQMLLGYNDTLKTLGVYEGWRYTLQKGSFKELCNEYIELISELRGIALPANTAGDAFVSYISSSIIRRMMKETSAKTVHSGWVYAIADMAGRAFALDSTHVYSQEEYITALLAEFNTIQLPSYEGTSGKALLDYLLAINDERVIIKILYNELLQMLNTRHSKFDMTFATGLVLMPSVFIAAFLVLINTKWQHTPLISN